MIAWCINIQWYQRKHLTARKALLLKEKEPTHLRDKINAERLALLRRSRRNL